MMTEGPFPIQHNWPGPGQHMWSRWQHKTGLPKPTQYRYCIHPDCKVIEERETPKA